VNEQYQYPKVKLLPFKLMHMSQARDSIVYSDEIWLIPSTQDGVSMSLTMLFVFLQDG